MTTVDVCVCYIDASFVYISLCWSVWNEGCRSVEQSSTSLSLPAVCDAEPTTSGLKCTTSYVERSSRAASLSSVNRRNENFDCVRIIIYTLTVLVMCIHSLFHQYIFKRQLHLNVSETVTFMFKWHISVIDAYPFVYLAQSFITYNRYIIQKRLVNL